MTAEEREQINALCACIQEEKDYAKFVVLLCELSDLLERKELRFVDESERRTRIIFSGDFELNDEPLRRLGVA
jgi:hypothetical protein